MIYFMEFQILTLDDKQGKILPDVKGELEFKNIYFACPSRAETVVLRNFNLGVMASQTVGLVGKSGSGKSTVINFLERFCDPLTGEILLDGVDLKSSGEIVKETNGHG